MAAAAVAVAGCGVAGKAGGRLREALTGARRTACLRWRGYVEGRLGRIDARRPVAVIATQAWPIQPTPPPPPAESPGAGSHASPREHLRRGHPRRIAIGTRRERLIWVRPTTVGTAAL